MSTETHLKQNYIGGRWVDSKGGKLHDVINPATEEAASTVVLGTVFAVLLVWGIWAMRTAYVGWSEHRITQRQLVGVAMRFCAMYLVLTFLLLS